MELAVARGKSLADSVFRVRRLDFGGIPAVELRDGSGARAVFALRGATLLDWRVQHEGEFVALTDGYRDADELASQNGVRNGIMAPFPNRIAGARYRFDGCEYDLLPGVPDAERLIYHGFLREMELVVAETSETPTGASVLFTGTIRPGDFPGYPFALDLAVRVGFTARSLGLSITARNVGETAAPYAAGWHPYFRLGEARIEELQLQVPADFCIVTDAGLLPLAGEAAYVAVDGASMPDFRLLRRIGEAVIDGCYGRSAIRASESVPAPGGGMRCASPALRNRHGGAEGDGHAIRREESGQMAAVPTSESVPAPHGGMRCASPALWTVLQRGDDRLIRSHLRDPATGRQLRVWQRDGLVHVFTGDTLARDPRRAVAIEPVEVMTDAFNRPDCARAIRLPAGATRSFSCGAEFDVAPCSNPPSSQPPAAPSA